MSRYRSPWQPTLQQRNAVRALAAPQAFDDAAMGRRTRFVRLGEKIVWRLGCPADMAELAMIRGYRDR